MRYGGRERALELLGGDDSAEATVGVNYEHRADAPQRLDAQQSFNRRLTDNGAGLAHRGVEQLADRRSRP